MISDFVLSKINFVKKKKQRRNSNKFDVLHFVLKSLFRKAKYL